MDNFSQTPQIILLSETHLAGMHQRMSLLENSTEVLWQGFMPMYKKYEIWDNTKLYAVEEYDATYFKKFEPQNTFTKWAAAPIKGNKTLPEGLFALTLPRGLYAVFTYKGLAADAAPMYMYIFTRWLPSSEYSLDDRPHFALMGEKYKNNSPESEEEIWVPVRVRSTIK
jgi:AraC family transcriptional regulator